MDTSTQHRQPASPPPTPAQLKHVGSKISADYQPDSEEEEEEEGAACQSGQSDSGLTIEEVAEGDLDTELSGEIVQPDELEEMVSEGSSSNGEDDHDGGNSDIGIARRMRRLSYADRKRAERRSTLLKNRRGSRLFKRTHSQSRIGDLGEWDSEGLDDQDADAGARRLRRRLRSPDSETPTKVEFGAKGMSQRRAMDEEGDAVMSGSGESSRTNSRVRDLKTLPFWMREDAMDIDAGIKS